VKREIGGAGTQIEMRGVEEDIYLSIMIAFATKSEDPSETTRDRSKSSDTNSQVTEAMTRYEEMQCDGLVLGRKNKIVQFLM
jgi:hypothetical protein